MEWFVNLPDWLVGILFVLFAVVVGVGGLLATRKWIGRLHVSISHNEAVSYYLSTVAIFYGIMLGLIAVGVWEGYDGARSAVGMEAGALAALYRDVSGYPEPERSALQADLREYTRYEIDVAWQTYRKGIITPGAGSCVCGVFRTGCRRSNRELRGKRHCTMRPCALSTSLSRNAAYG